MCLYINSDKHIKEKGDYFIAKKAEKAIKVYKVLLKNGDGLYNTLNINGRDQHWRKGFIYEETDFPKRKKGSCAENGFHSYATKLKAINLTKACYAGESAVKIVEMYIPKGAYYFEGRSNEYFSSHLKYV